MKTQNTTPYAVLSFPFVDREGAPFHAVIVKGTFAIEKDKPLTIAAEQAPIRAEDEAWADGATSSLRYESDLAPFKPATDVIVHATAHAPDKKPAPAWHAGISVGELKKRLVVTGPRAFAYTKKRGWTLGPIKPVDEVPIRYERAFGGAIKVGERLEAYPNNPVGVGYVDPRAADRARAHAAPQILAADGRPPVFGEPYPVEGLCAIPRTWEPRRARVGSAEPGQKLPRDFDPLYFNAAHDDLISDGFLRGDEVVMLENLHPEHAALSFTLPWMIVAAAIVDRAGYRYGAPARLDTVLIDAERMRAELTWRATLPLYDDGVAHLDVATRAMLPDPPGERGRA